MSFAERDERTTMSCCAVGCTNPFNKFDKNRKFYRIPSTRTPFKANRRSDWNEQIIKNATICSDHFISGEASDDFDSPDFVPSIFPYSTQSVKDGDTKLERERDETPRRCPDNGHQSTSTSLSPNDCEIEPEAMVPKAVHDDLKQKYSQLHTECDNLRVDINKLKAENEQLRATVRSTQFSFASIQCKAAQVLFFTGLTSALFNWTLHAVKDSVEVVRGSLTLEDHLLAILMKLRLGLTNKDIAFRFNVTQCDISNILRSWLPVLSQTLKPLIKWPSKHAILKNMPNCFKRKYKRCRCIIDCTEIFINRPTNLTARAQTYSNYKSHNTVKYLVGMSPAGAITFMSSGWGGRVSDKQITAESGFYDLLEVNDEILEDRGFTIRDELALCGATLRIPHFTRGKKQLSAQEVETSRRLSNVRIHIERIIGRWKTFRILTTVVPLSQVDLLDDIVIVLENVSSLFSCNSVEENPLRFSSYRAASGSSGSSFSLSDSDAVSVSLQSRLILYIPLRSTY
ncbi:hypothetical protein N1851_003038 [Merluccius polli]|uniref:THAP-type domain-containing protein n=1 Tax=Merluccius polli TaxID=89951 RepID=A0AA47NAI9_MERPO|nr:hypothetical protein N1851_003038 [Merluccius polli]